MNASNLLLVCGAALALSACERPYLQTEYHPDASSDRFRNELRGYVVSEETDSARNKTSVYILRFCTGYDGTWGREEFEIVMPTDFTKPGDIIMMDLEAKTWRFVDPNDPWIAIEDQQKVERQ